MIIAPWKILDAIIKNANQSTSEGIRRHHGYELGFKDGVEWALKEVQNKSERTPEDDAEHASMFRSFFDMEC